MKAYQLKITIKGSKPPIWRRCIVPAGLSFSQFTLALREIMGWCGYHLSEYKFQNLQVSLVENAGEDDFGSWKTEEELDSSEYLIDEFFEDVKSFTYIYDFGDDWEHKIDIEKVIPDYEHDYPMVIKYKGDCLPEDCGGIWGYYNLLDTLQNPDDPEYESMKEWYGADEDYVYDLEAVNRRLSRMVKTSKEIAPITEQELSEKWFDGKLKFDQVVPPADRDEEDDYDDDMWGDLPEDFDPKELIAGVFQTTLANVRNLLRKNAKMSDEKIRKVLELDEEIWMNICAMADSDAFGEVFGDSDI